MSGEKFWDGVYMSPTNAQATIIFRKPIELSEVSVHSGHISWRQICDVEDFTLEGLTDGAWRPLAAVKNASAAKADDRLAPNVCRFPRQQLDGLRLTATRGFHPTCLVLRAIQGK